MAKWLLYGANGYTGKLIAEHAVDRGHQPILAGRSEAKIRPLAEKLELDYAVIKLNDNFSLAKAVSEVDLVLHAAGPFKHTAHPMIKACIAGRSHYLDITGEIDVFEYAFSHFNEAISSGIVLLPGVGFDVIPTDCLAKYVSEQLQDATHLEIAFSTAGGMSPGTSKTMLESADIGPGLARKNGVLQTLPKRIETKQVEFSHKSLSTVAIPWGDLVTAFHSTGIPNITTYFALPPHQIRQMGRLGWMMKLLKVPPFKRVANFYVERNVLGPSEETRNRAKSYIWAKASNGAGQSAEAWLETMEAYKLTAMGAVKCVEKVLETNLLGTYTPSAAFGADFVLELPGTIRYDQRPV